jgi:dTMP kinase
VDRCGKTTQCTRLLEFLKGSIGADKVEFMRFPDRTTSIGTTINSYLTNAQEMDDRAIHLLFAANRWEAAANIRKKLAEGVTIVCDRYSYSGVAFTSAKPGMDLDVSRGPSFSLG